MQAVVRQKVLAWSTNVLLNSHSQSCSKQVSLGSAQFVPPRWSCHSVILLNLSSNWGQESRGLGHGLLLTLVPHNDATFCMQVLNAVTERLMDFDEKVRSGAIAAICDAAVKNLQVETGSWQSSTLKIMPFISSGHGSGMSL